MTVRPKGFKFIFRLYTWGIVLNRLCNNTMCGELSSEYGAGRLLNVGRVVLGRVFFGASCLGASCLSGELSCYH